MLVWFAQKIGESKTISHVYLYRYLHRLCRVRCALAPVMKVHRTSTVSAASVGRSVSKPGNHYAAGGLLLDSRRWTRLRARQARR